MVKTVHNNTQKTLFWNKEVSEPRSVDTLLGKWGREVQRGERRSGYIMKGRGEKRVEGKNKMKGRKFGNYALK